MAVRSKGSKGGGGRTPMDILAGKLDPPTKLTQEHMRLTPFGSGLKVERSPELLAYLGKIAERRAQLARVPVAPEIKHDRQSDLGNTIQSRSKRTDKDPDLDL